MNELKDIFSSIKNAFGTIVTPVKEGLHQLVEVKDTIFGGFRDVWKDMCNLFSGGQDGLKEVAKSVQTSKTQEELDAVKKDVAT